LIIGVKFLSASNSLPILCKESGKEKSYFEIDSDSIQTAQSKTVEIIHILTLKNRLFLRNTQLPASLKE